MEDRSSVMPKTGRRAAVLAAVLVILAMIIFFLIAALGDVFVRGGQSSPDSSPPGTVMAATPGPSGPER